MAYTLDRQKIIRLSDAVAVLNFKRHGMRAQLIFKDGSIHPTLTRAKTLIGLLNRPWEETQAQKKRSRKA